MPWVASCMFKKKTDLIGHTCCKNNIMRAYSIKLRVKFSPRFCGRFLEWCLFHTYGLHILCFTTVFK